MKTKQHIPGHRLLRLPQLAYAFTKKLVIPLVGLMVLLSACKRDPDPAPLDALTARAGDDQQVQVGQVVSIDGSASQAPQNQPFTIQWVMLRKPAKSSATLSSTATIKSTFTPDEVGEYELELTLSSAAGKSTDKVVIVAAVAQPLTIDKDITVKTLLVDRLTNPNLPDYIVPKDLAVKAELTLAPGVVVAFERDVRLSINDNGGILIAQGTPQKKIRFLGVNQTRGYWAGIMLYSKSNVNLMEQVEILHAGSSPMLDNTKMGMALFKGSQIAFKNTLFSQHDGYGLYVYEEAVLREFTANSFTSNAEAGIVLPPESVAKLDAASQFTGANGRNVVEVKGEYLGNNSAQGTVIAWPGFADKTPYRIMRRMQVRSGWKLSPGVIIEVARDVSIIVDETGYLNAVGTPAQRITFTGAAGQAAYWTGILSHSTSNQSRLENADILNAGSTAILSTKRANLALYGNNASLTLRNTRIVGSGGYGVYVGFQATLNTDETATYEGNALANVFIDK
ncbi:right-handed parallel beta-helix repeat-containing protein [Fibrella forsythiae]|uniref:Right-handed parallel beta-helix repeat-containing protein n=1 Tax=Fibrella forsythiae TaxID=2817061 RepID=A0ABS3JSD2_9BACT|nr:right-handed parallel beta-helix repeat-containing protein [Fibrella forsythiae]MBO0952883.1 right-handed parallel beta-helix repeat-containing protein [Fibrella forsythiae]